jgi:hypothetical protein
MKAEKKTAKAIIVPDYSSGKGVEDGFQPVVRKWI